MTFISKIAIARPRLIRYRRRMFDDGMILEMALWDVPVLGRAHRLEYKLSYGDAEGRLIGYDNTAGDHDHWRHRDHETRHYEFVSPERLIADFLADVRAARHNG